MIASKNRKWSCSKINRRLWQTVPQAPGANLLQQWVNTLQPSNGKFRLKGSAMTQLWIKDSHAWTQERRSWNKELPAPQRKRVFWDEKHKKAPRESHWADTELPNHHRYHLAKTFHNLLAYKKPPQVLTLYGKAIEWMNFFDSITV